MSDNWSDCNKGKMVMIITYLNAIFSLVEDKLRRDDSLIQSAIKNKLGLVKVNSKTSFGYYGESNFLNFSMSSKKKQIHFPRDTCPSPGHCHTASFW